MEVISLVLLLSLLALSSALSPACTVGQFQPGNNDPKKPDLSQYLMYEVHMEANIVNKNYTIDYTEYFDYNGKRAATHVVRDGGRTENIYNFNTNELFHIDRDNIAGLTCTVENLANSSRLFLFGNKTAQNQAVMFKAGSAFRFSNSQSEQWINVTSVRGVPCNLWRSCVKFPSGSTMVVDWYFSVPGWTTTEFPLEQVPIRAHVKGVGMGRGPNQQHTFEHFYDFMNFKTSLTDLTVFETREGAYCPGRKSTKPLPTPVNHFHFNSEILDLDGQQIGGIKEYYDNTMNLVRFDLIPMSISPYGPNPQTQIHDFKTGVAYIIDQLRGNCSVTNISNVGFDVRSADPTHIRMRSSMEFFYFDKFSYNYEGTKVARNILCDVWITQRNDWPPHAPGNPLSTWEWYFATPDYMANLPDNLLFGMPVMLEINAGVNGHYIYNIYDYDEKMPKVLDYDIDIGQCFNYTERQDFSFLLPGNFRATASSNLDNFKYAVLTAIVNAANGISRLRINNIQIDYADNNDIIVTFTLLDRPPPIGDVLKPKLEPDLNTVASQITTAINKGTFKVNFTPSGATKPAIMTAKQNTFQATQRIIKRQYITQVSPGTTTTSGYSGGVMAGMGVALLVVFFIVGVLGMYLFYRKQGGAFLPKKFDNTDITQDVS